MAKLLIKNGILIDPAQNLSAPKDLLVEDGKIKAIEDPGKIPADHATIIDAKGCWVTPGLIDAHVHLREPGLEYKETIETGTRAAIAGGFTSVACMANTSPVNDSPYVTAYIRERAKALAACRVFPIGAVTKGLQGQELAEIGSMIEEGAVALSDDGMPVMNSYLMRKAMDYATAFNVPIISHAEDLNLVGKGVMNEGALSNELGLRGNPAAAEEILVAREISLARLTGCRVHIAHVSTELAIRHIQRAKEEGLAITAEVTPHHLDLTEDAVRTYNTHCKMAPPLRQKKDNEALIKALAEGVIDLIATDHAPHGVVDKSTEFDQAAFGITGVQSAVPVTLKPVLEGKINRETWVKALTLAPAKLLNLDLGHLKIGAKADITVIDPKAKWIFSEDLNQSKGKNSPYLGEELTGKVTHTLLEGKVVYEV